MYTNITLKPRVVIMAASDQEAEVIERRLRPVYGQRTGYYLQNGVYMRFFLQPVDAIDNGQNKKAIQQADKILKKYPKLHCAKVWTIL